MKLIMQETAKNKRMGEVNMRILIIGGTGTISMAITKLLAKGNDEVYLINRGNRNDEVPENINLFTVDIDDERAVNELTQDMHFDAVCEFIGFEPEQIERDYRLFKGKTNQYIYISSASAYHKPAKSYVINEGTALANPYWEYSRNKIKCEELLMKLYREEGFPVTIVRPSHTYDERSVPLGVHGNGGSYQVVKRMLEGKKVIIHGDGTSLWTMTHNSDFARGYVGLIGNPHAIGEAFQITSDETLTWNQIYEAVAGALGVKLNCIHVSSEFLAAVSDFDFEGSLIGDKAESVVFDNSKLKKVVPDFETKVRFEQGIRATIENVLNNDELQIEDKEFDKWCDDVIEAIENIKRDFNK